MHPDNLVASKIRCQKSEVLDDLNHLYMPTKFCIANLCRTLREVGHFLSKTTTSHLY